MGICKTSTNVLGLRCLWSGKNEFFDGCDLFAIGKPFNMIQLRLDGVDKTDIVSALQLNEEFFYTLISSVGQTA